MPEKPKNPREDQQQSGQQSGQPSQQPSQGDQSETIKPDGDDTVDTNAGPDATQGTIADQPDEPEEAK